MVVGQDIGGKVIGREFGLDVRKACVVRNARSLAEEVNKFIENSQIALQVGVSHDVETDVLAAPGEQRRYANPY